jgi:hypothetical protein
MALAGLRGSVMATDERDGHRGGRMHLEPSGRDSFGFETECFLQLGLH